MALFSFARTPEVMLRAGGQLRRGLTLIEVALTLIITTAALAAGAQVYSEYLRAKTNQVVAEHMRVVSAAYGRYLHDNSGDVINQAKLSPTRDVLGVVTVKELVDQGYLHEGFRGDGELNPFGQRYIFYSKFLQEGADPDKGRLESFVYTEGGQSVDIKDALTISQLIGAGGAFVDAEQNIRSSYGDFTLQLSDIRAGADTRTGNLVTAMFFNDNNAVTSDYLYRNEASDPSLNTMSTHLRMGGYNIDDVDSISASGEVEASVMMAGTLSANSATIPELHGDTKVHGQVESDSLSTGSADITGEVSSGSLKTGSVNAATITASGRVTANEFIHLNRVVVEGASCAPNGLLGRDSGGKILSCQSGVWKGIAASGGVCRNGRIVSLGSANTVTNNSDCDWILFVRRSMNKHSHALVYFNGVNVVDSYDAGYSVSDTFSVPVPVGVTLKVASTGYASSFRLYRN